MNCEALEFVKFEKLNSIATIQSEDFGVGFFFVRRQRTVDEPTEATITITSVIGDS